MAYGKFGFDGDPRRLPVSLSAFSKMRMGWANVTEIAATGTYALRAGINQVAKIVRGFHDGGRRRPEYLLLENRQPVGYDSGMTGGGIAVYHVDEDVRRQDRPGFPNMTDVAAYADAGAYPANGRHYGVRLVASDGDYGLERRRTPGAGGELLWHAGSRLQALGTTGFPSTRTYQGDAVRETGIVLRDFGASADRMTFRVEFQNANAG